MLSRTKKRALALFLAIVMVMGLLPTAALAAGFSEDEVGLITEENEGYVLKFKTMELWGQLKEKFK